LRRARAPARAGLTAAAGGAAKGAGKAAKARARRGQGGQGAGKAAKARAPMRRDATECDIWPRSARARAGLSKNRIWLLDSGLVLLSL
jgi:hypothetical protein